MNLQLYFVVELWDVKHPLYEGFTSEFRWAICSTLAKYINYWVTVKGAPFSSTCAKGYFFFYTRNQLCMFWIWYYCHVDRDASLSVGKILLHHYKSDLAHTSDRYSSVIELHLS